jgi:hypothetical protein
VFSQIFKYRNSSQSGVLAFMFEQASERWNGEAQCFMKLVFVSTFSDGYYGTLLPLTMFS